MDYAKSTSAGDRLYDIAIYTILTVIMLGTLYPLIYIVSASLSDPMAIVKGELWLLPKDMTLDAYRKVFENSDILMGYRNSLIYLVAGTAINLIMTTMGAYALSRQDLRGRHILALIFTFTLLFNGGLIPTYLVFKNMLGLYNNLWVMIIPSAVSVWNLIVMRTYFQTAIPYELQEAAFIDGCSNIKTLTRIVLPLSMPILAVMTMYYGVAHWNSYFTALIYLNDHWRLPLQVVIRSILIQENMYAMAGGDGESLVEQLLLVEGMKYAVIVVSSIPMLLLYPLVQRHFVKGVMIGAVKG
ncbi:putative aldouronate transport system permease protein [Paenibacillus sp. UNCCL117]|uniref:carbohydrate ABC transporter permease n=1 Tax=unclassified Paenibacillus TaxID=185978 RepID=UPI0008855C9B|nr:MULTISPECIES: carbohydrate ABC transporter permease [unclassified Paenibacillus]SDC15217.1 putative aldouronate transport system permease protein [Paenibacillus sp. cl123]SFW17498.1 putative aldouronate transport system permease protein [Paenibacillus sp. UNCCL117]